MKKHLMLYIALAVIATTLVVLGSLYWLPLMVVGFAMFIVLAILTYAL